jgi:hypothetical protein
MNKRLCFLVFITSLVVGSTTLTPSYATQPGSWEQLHNVAIPNPGIMFLLTNGSVLIQDQGFNNSGSENWWILTPDSHGSYVDGSWKQTGSTPSNYKPMYAASSVLPDGRVLVLGGELNGSSDWVGLNTGEIYDPSTGS